MSKVIGTANQYIFAETFFDDHSRPTQVRSINYTGGIDTITTQYAFNGKILRTFLNHQKNGNTTQHHNILTKFNYDAAGRQKNIWKNIDGAQSDQLIDSIQYNELGQLRAKFIGNSVDSLIYGYNIRGWLSGINKNYVLGSANNYFGMELGYDKTTSVAPGNTYTNPQFNGNIAGTVWKSAGSNVNRKYDFSYDNADRISAASFGQYNGTNFDVSAGIDFSVSGLTYDANSNIMTLTQRGFTVGGSSVIDSLNYTYLNSNGSNRLQQVMDINNNPATLLGDFHYPTGKSPGTDYSYDGNGNPTKDNNKAIDNISYNYLNLPQSVHINGKGNIQFIYDATGVKLAKIVSDSTIRHSTTTLFVGNFIYQQNDTITNQGGGVDTLQFILHEEGRTRWAYHKYTTGTTAYGMEYDFFEKDHLGNTRMVLTQQRDTANYLASMEAAYRTTESALFGNIAATSYLRSSVMGYPNDHSYTNPNDSVAKVDFNGSTGHTTGPNLLLKVMSGDTIRMLVQSYYNSGSGGTNNSSFTDVLNSLAGGLVNATGGAHGMLSDLTTNGSSVYTGLTSFPSNNDSTHAGYPKAYLNWIFLDDQFNYVSSLSGAVLAASSTYPEGQLNTVAPGSQLSINRNGYLYVWVSNETQGWDMFFDNLFVQHKQGPLLEENHYYPFGLTMAGISDKALKAQYAENKYRYNGKELQHQEFSDGTGWEEYDYGARMQDPQLGKFLQIDPHADNHQTYSTYSYVGDNPINATDPTGMDTYLSGEAAQEFVKELQGLYTLNAYGFNTNLSGGGLDAVAQNVMNEDDNPEDDNFTIKGVLPVYQSITPEIYGLTRYAQSVLGYDNVLIRTMIGYNKLQRRIALRDWSGYDRKWNPLYSVDEYPVASSEEGGFDVDLNRPIVTGLVPVDEQQIQAGQIGALYTVVGVGDRFVVVPISNSKHPQPSDYPAFKINDPDGRWIPIGNRIYRPGYDPKDLEKFRIPEKKPIPVPIPIRILEGALEAAEYVL